MRSFALAFGASVVLLSVSASAHFKMVTPPSPTNSVDGKGPPPCGPDTGDGVVTTVTGGSMIPISVTENVRHGGFYRVALALKNCKTVGCFPENNKVYDKDNKLLNPTGPGDSDHADFEVNPKFPILADNLFPHAQAGSGETYSGMIAIPNINCDKCTMQVIEFMAPHGPNGAAGYFYHHCSDLKITADPNKPIFNPSGSGGTGGTGAGGAAGAGGSGTGGASAGTGTGGTGGASAGTASGGTTSAGTTSTAGTTTTAGTTSTAGTATTPTAGTTSTIGNGTAEDDGGCGIAKHSSGSASLVAALGLMYALVRRRRAS